MKEDRIHFYKSIRIPLGLILSMWSIKLVELIFAVDFTHYGLLPRDFYGLIGIFTFPLIHSDWSHLLSNTLPLLFLGTGTFYFYPSSSSKVTVIIYFVTGMLVWLFARQAYHIGASGLIYGFAAFLFFSGLIRRDTRSITLALLVTFLYGSFIWGVLPLDEKVSWEGHLFGAIVGIVCAFVFKKSDPYKKYDWEDDPDYDKNEKPEISYDDTEF